MLPAAAVMREEEEEEEEDALQGGGEGGERQCYRLSDSAPVLPSSPVTSGNKPAAVADSSFISSKTPS